MNETVSSTQVWSIKFLINLIMFPTRTIILLYNRTLFDKNDSNMIKSFTNLLFVRQKWNFWALSERLIAFADSKFEIKLKSTKEEKHKIVNKPFWISDEHFLLTDSICRKLSFIAKVLFNTVYANFPWNFRYELNI
jgi:hypothetical protein